MPDSSDFSSRLRSATARSGRLCVGIDPHPSMLTAWGLSVDVRGLETCARTMAAAVAGDVAVAKPQSAFFEAFGSAGIAVLERVLDDLREGGVLSLLDVKRGDLSSTMAAYAHAYLHPDSTLRADAITLSPYLGFGSLAPALELAQEHGRGIFVLARTSNPEGTRLQGARLEDGSVAQDIVGQATLANSAAGSGLVGLVVGGTHEDIGLELSGFDGPVLIPGLGAQGATPTDLVRRFAGCPGILLPSSSRAIMAAGPAERRIRTEVSRLRDELVAAEGGNARSIG